jgi:hypothetical protein
MAGLVQQSPDSGAHRLHPPGRSRGTLLRHAERHTHGRVTQTKWPPAKPERFNSLLPSPPSWPCEGGVRPIFWTVFGRGSFGPVEPVWSDVRFRDTKEAGGVYPNKFVCTGCFDDDRLKTFIEDAVTRRTCSYCGKRSRRKNIAAPVDDVFERMFESVRRRHGEAWASGCSWDSEDD